MIIKSTEKNNNKATIVVEIEKELMNKGAEKAYLKARKNIRIPGFRPGKAPRKFIEKMYGAFVFFEDGLEEIFPEVYDFAIGGNTEIKAIGRPSLQDMDIAEDGTTTLTLTTEVYPEVTLGQYKGVEVVKGTAEVTDAQVEAELGRIAENLASVETVERAAEMGDIANINFLGTIDGIAFEGGAAENFDLTLGSGQFIPGFEEQVVGMNVGEDKDVNVTFPADYNSKELAGKAAVFAVKLNKLSVKNVPAIDDELAKDASEFETLEELKADIREKKLADAQKQIDRAFENAVVEAVAANATVEVPEALVEVELDNQMNDFAYRLQMSGMSVEQYAKMMGGDMSTMRQAFKPNAEKQALNNLVVEKVGEVEGITVSEEEMEAEFARLAKSYELEVEKVKEMVTAEEIKTNLQTVKTVAFLVENAVAKAE